MAETRVQASYKKKDGTLLLTASQDQLSWTPSAAPTGPPTVTIAISSIANLQATPATSAKVMLRVLVSAQGSGTPAQGQEAATETFVFQFTGGEARALMDRMKEALTAAIQAYKAGANGGTGSSVGTPSASGGGVPPGAGAGSTMAIASALNSGGSAGKKDDMSDAALLADMDLMQEVLESSPALMKTFMETVVQDQSITSAQFWSTRLGLLRSHAIRKRQKRGPYNVLGTIKSKVVDNVTTYSITREQIAEIFEQHPLIRRVYDENVPRLAEGEFWKKFLSSRLCKKLRGERINPQDPWDDIMDKYLELDDNANARKNPLAHLPVPTTINLAHNVQNISFPGGNRPDITMRPSITPIVKQLNSLSYKFVDSVTPADVDPKQTSTRLEDLDPEEVEETLKLPLLRPASNIKDSASESAVPTATLQNSLLSSLDAVDLSSFSTAHSPLAVKHLSSTLNPTHNIPPRDPPPSAALVHATTLEFLRHFYAAFLSGNAKRTGEAERLVASLRRAGERIEAVEGEVGGEAGLVGVKGCVGVAVAWWEESIKLAS